LGPFVSDGDAVGEHRGAHRHDPTRQRDVPGASRRRALWQAPLADAHHPGVVILSHRSLALWWLGYPEAALADAERGLKDARQIGQAATLMVALAFTSWTHIHCGNYATANTQADELVSLADEKGALYWKALGTIQQGVVLALNGQASRLVQILTPAITALRSTGMVLGHPGRLSLLAWGYSELNQYDDAWRCIDEAMAVMKTTKETFNEAGINLRAGIIALKSPEPDAAKAEAYFEHALAVAREQQAKSWELRAAMSMARLWRDQGKRGEARDLLAPVYDWFTEGFDTLDLKEAKTLLDELHT
jgi:predicted ATPase